MLTAVSSRKTIGRSTHEGRANSESALVGYLQFQTFPVVRQDGGDAVMLRIEAGNHRSGLGPVESGTGSRRWSSRPVDLNGHEFPPRRESTAVRIDDHRQSLRCPVASECHAKEVALLKRVALPVVQVETPAAVASCLSRRIDTQG